MKRRNPQQFYCKTGKLFCGLLLAISLQLPALSGGLQNSASQEFAEVPFLPDMQSPRSQFDCLPEGFQLKDQVSASSKGQDSKQPLTIGDRLLELKARCKKGKLFDGKGREIRLFKPSCFGNRPDNYEEIVQKESQELADLQKRYAVIVIACGRNIH
jgi:hypothetical protein